MMRRSSLIGMLLVFVIIWIGGIGPVWGDESGISGWSEPVTDHNWPPGAVSMANRPDRFKYHAGWPEDDMFAYDEQGYYDFSYRGKNTAAFQSDLDAFAAIAAPRLELYVSDGLTTKTRATYEDPPVPWKFRVWDAKAYQRFQDASQNNWDSSIFGDPLPAPSLTVTLGFDNPVDWSAVRVPPNVTLLDRRVRTSPWADSKGGVVRVLVKDMFTSAPLSGVNVEWRETEDSVHDGYLISSAITRSDGVALFRDIPEGYYELHLSRDGYAFCLREFSNSSREVTDIDPILLCPSSQLTGRVVDEKGAPIPNAKVATRLVLAPDGRQYSQGFRSYLEANREGKSDADGRFRLTGLPRGKVTLWAGKIGYNFGGDTEPTLPPPYLHPVSGPEVSIRMTRTGSVSGHVLGIDRVPPGETVYVDLLYSGDQSSGHWGGGGATCDRDGAYAIADVPEGEYSVHAWATGKPLAAAGSIVVKHAQDVKFDLTLSGSIDSGGNEPVVDRNWPSGSVRMANLPDRSGYYAGWPDDVMSMTNEPGSYTFIYRAKDAAAFQSALDAFAAIVAPRRDLFVYDSDTSTARSPLEPLQARWEFKVWDAKAFMLFESMGEISQIDWRFIDSSLFRQRIPDPSLTVTLGAGNSIDWSRVRVPAGVSLNDRRVKTSKWADSKGGVVHAVVKDIFTSSPLSGATVELRQLTSENESRSAASVITGGDGAVVIRNLPEGLYFLQVRRPGYASRRTEEFKTSISNVRVFDSILLAPDNALTGRVTDTKGTPLEGVEIDVYRMLGPDDDRYDTGNRISKVVSGSDGRFRLAGLAQGSVCVSACKHGYHFSEYGFHAVPGPEVSLTMSPTGRIYGHVLGMTPAAKREVLRVILDGDWKEGTPEMRSAFDQHTCEPDGAFAFDDLPAGQYSLEANRAGNIAKVSDFELKPGQILNLDLILRPRE